MNQNEIKEIMECFRKEICEQYETVDPTEQYDWHDLSIGYFLAKGLSIEEAKQLAITVRYEHHYWMN